MVEIWGSGFFGRQYQWPFVSGCVCVQDLCECRAEFGTDEVGCWAELSRYPECKLRVRPNSTDPFLVVAAAP